MERIVPLGSFVSNLAEVHTAAYRQLYNSNVPWLHWELGIRAEVVLSHGQEPGSPEQPPHQEWCAYGRWRRMNLPSRTEPLTTAAPPGP